MSDHRINLKMDQSDRAVENIQLHSRLVENILSIEWIIENVECFESRLTGLTLESPVFSSKYGGHNWQLVMSVRSACSSSLSLQLHKSSTVKRACIAYHFGIADMVGNLEFEDQGHTNFESETSTPKYPTILFSWPQFLEVKDKLFHNGRLRILCHIDVLDCENLPLKKVTEILFVSTYYLLLIVCNNMYLT